MLGSPWRAPALSSLLVVASCGSDRSAPRGLEIAVAPITLEGIGEACFDLRVQNAPGGVAGGGQTVWSKGTPGHQTPSEGPDEVLAGDPDAVCSGQYGNGDGGDITYIGTCDADGQEDGWPATGDAAGERTNSITLWFDGLYDADGLYIDPAGLNGWQDPCEGPNGCHLEMLCEENADTTVTFNFTVMRDAQQGFFDIAVNFEDVFCSAKFDTCYDDNPNTAADESGRIQLLMKDTNGDGGGDTRWDTGNLAFACTGGPDADTNLYFDDVVIVCGDQTIVLDPSQDEGGNVAAPEGQSIVFGYATYFGEEQLACPPGNESPSCGKRYWNMAIGFDTDGGHELSDVCTLYASATASDGEFDNGADWVTPPHHTYPVIRFAVPLTPFAASDDDYTLACGNWGLDETGEGDLVYSDYTSIDCTVDEESDFSNGGEDDCDFCHRYGAEPGIPEGSTREECGGGGEPALEPLRVFVTSQGFTGGFGGLAGADDLCNQAAFNAGLVGDFKAWLGLANGAPADRFPETWLDTGRPFALVDGTPIADNWADLVDGDILNPINLSEDGEDYWTDVGNGWVWTNTNSDGTVHVDGFGSQHACDDFFSSGIEQYPYAGSVMRFDGGWAFDAPVSPIDDACTQELPIYCFEQPRALRAFVTSEGFQGDFGGLDGADDICQFSAEFAGWPGSYRAWLSVGSNSPSNRFTPETLSGHPFELIDGTLLAHDWADLTDGSIRTPIDVTEYIEVDVEENVWTNTRTDGTTSELGAGPTCDGYTTADPAAFQQTIGQTFQTTDRWTGWSAAGTTVGCNFSWRLYCFEQSPNTNL